MKAFRNVMWLIWLCIAGVTLGAFGDFFSNSSQIPLGTILNWLYLLFSKLGLNIRPPEFANTIIGCGLSLVLFGYASSKLKKAYDEMLPYQIKEVTNHKKFSKVVLNLSLPTKGHKIECDGEVIKYSGKVVNDVKELKKRLEEDQVKHNWKQWWATMEANDGEVNYVDFVVTEQSEPYADLARVMCTKFFNVPKENINIESVAGNEENMDRLLGVYQKIIKTAEERPGELVIDVTGCSKLMSLAGALTTTSNRHHVCYVTRKLKYIVFDMVRISRT